MKENRLGKLKADDGSAIEYFIGDRESLKGAKERRRERNNLLSHIESHIENMRFSPKITRTFEVGDEVDFGNHGDVTVRSVETDGVYTVNLPNNGQSIGDVAVVFWYDIFHKGVRGETEFYKGLAPRLNFQNNDVSSLLGRALSFGIDFEPTYQRELCWTMEDKHEFIDSVMRNIDIGKFVFKRLLFKINAPAHEIVDGKQRLTTLLQFYGDQFRYNGYLYSELSNRDKHTFKDCPVVSAILSENTDLKTILDIFLSINTKGRQATEEDLSKARQMLKELKEVI